MRLLPSRICRLSVAILLGLQVLISGCASTRETERTECLNNLPRNSYIYNYSRQFFYRPTPGSEVIDLATRILTLPIGLPQFLGAVLSDTLLLPVTVPLERSYQSRCKEMKDQIASEQNKSIKGHLNTASKESITLPSFASQTVFGQTPIWDDFVEKGLPASADLPMDNLDRAAESMAKQISQSDGQSLSVLLAALQTAGFSIIDEKRTVLRKPLGGSTGQGLGFYDFEAVGSLKLDTRRISVSLEKLAGAIIKDVPQIAAPQFAEMMMTDLRRQATNINNTYLRFWARLIIELGKYSAEPVDLMTAPASRINLSMLQTSLLLKRLQGDIFTLKVRLSLSGAIQTPLSPRHFVVVNLGTMAGVPLVHLVKDSPSDSLPCSLTGGEGLILDAAGNGLSFGNGEFMKLVEKAYKGSKAGEVLDKLRNGVMAVNWVLGWGKLVAAVTALKGEITVENPPLIRTETSQKGEKRLMTAKVWSEVGKKQLLNCYRTAANIATGLDFNLPSDGPLADTAIGWNFASRKEAEFVFLDPPQDQDDIPLTQLTDSKGISQMYLVGQSKIPAVVYLKNPKKVTKTANVWVFVTLKSSKDFIQNWIDIGGAVLGGIRGASGSIAELGFRLPYTIAWAAIPVIDREPVSGYKLAQKPVERTHMDGVVCSFKKPFTFSMIDPAFTTTYTLVPSSATAGRWTSRYTYRASTYVRFEASGPYTIEGADTDTPYIVTRLEGTASMAFDPRFSSITVPWEESRGHVGYFELVPLETEECNEP